MVLYVLITVSYLEHRGLGCSAAVIYRPHAHGVFPGNCGLQSTILKAGLLEPNNAAFLSLRTYFCCGGRAVIQPNSFPDTEQILKVTTFAGSKGCSL
jgi:hypothetical protein